MCPHGGPGGGGGARTHQLLFWRGGWHPGLRTQPGVSAPPRPPRPHSAAGRDRSCARLTAQSSASAPSRSCSNSPDLGFFPFFFFFFVVVVVVAPFFLRRRPAPGLPKKRSGFLIPGLQSCCWRPRGLQRANGSAGRAGGEGADGDEMGWEGDGVGTKWDGRGTGGEGWGGVGWDGRRGVWGRMGTKWDGMGGGWGWDGDGDEMG